MKPLLGVLFRLHWLRLRRDPAALALMFVMPLLFFSTMTEIQRNLLRPDEHRRVSVGFVDLDNSALSQAVVISALHNRDLAARKIDNLRQVPTASQAARIMHQQALSVLVVFPEGLGRSAYRAGPPADSILLFEDRADPIGSQTFAAAIRMITLGEMVRLAVGAGTSGGSELFHQIDAFGAGDHRHRRDVVVSYSAAGDGVLFLLFAMAMAGLVTLEEEEQGILERIFTSGARPLDLLLVRAAFLGLVGSLQVAAMFVWAALIYKLAILENLASFVVLTLSVAFAAATFGLFLTMLCRSRQQLIGISTIVIVIVAALGGSLFPSYLMNDQLRRAGLFTFNGWALDGYHRLFWYGDPLSSILANIAVQLLAGAIFLTLALVLARRWNAK